ncbi:hypothetical protein M378DRAFT_89995, partial [Amanita muscaria Koide BX008]
DRLSKKWNTSIYAFFKRRPTIEYKGKDRIHAFECIATSCKGKGKNQRFVRRNLGTRNSTSTSNLRKHAILCWGKEVVEATSQAKSVDDARTVLKGKQSNLRDGTIVLEFEHMGHGKEKYSHRPPLKIETRAHHVLWMAESKRPFNLVVDSGYLRLMMSEISGAGYNQSQIVTGL